MFALDFEAEVGQEIIWGTGVISFMWVGGSRCIVYFQQRIHINAHATVTSEMRIYGFAVSGWCNDCDIAKRADIYYVSDVCRSLASTDNARLLPQLINLFENVDINAICRAGVPNVNSDGGPVLPFWRPKQMTVIVIARRLFRHGMQRNVS